MSCKRLLIYSLTVFLLYLIFKRYYICKNNSLTPIEAFNAINNKEFDYIVDVRTNQEWDEGHLPIAIHIPIGEFVTLLPQKIPNKNSRILFYCKKGFRASGTVEIAKKLGYNNVNYVDGGYDALKKLFNL